MVISVAQSWEKRCWGLRGHALVVKTFLMSDILVGWLANNLLGTCIVGGNWRGSSGIMREERRGSRSRGAQMRAMDD